MNEIPALALAGLAGLVLGAFFFAGLWWTIQMAVSSRRPALLFIGSLLMRTGIVLAFFYFIGHADWQRLVTCLTGFVVARAIALRSTRPVLAKESTSPRKVSHAP